MTEDRCYDLMDEVNCADTCEAVTALCELVDELMKDKDKTDETAKE